MEDAKSGKKKDKRKKEQGHGAEEMNGINGDVAEQDGTAKKKKKKSKDEVAAASETKKKRKSKE